jgi:hypothetical protein
MIDYVIGCPSRPVGSYAANGYIYTDTLLISLHLVPPLTTPVSISVYVYIASIAVLSIASRQTLTGPPVVL